MKERGFYIPRQRRDGHFLVIDGCPTDVEISEKEAQGG
jgi:hypothetical protein